MPPCPPLEETLRPFLHTLVSQAKRCNHRYLLVFSGGSQWLQASLNTTLASGELKSMAWLGEDSPAGVQDLHGVRPEHVLGKELQNVVIDAREHFSVDLFAALAGTIKGGGILLLLVPPLAQWPEQRDKTRQNTNSRFLQRFIHFLKTETNVLIWEEGSDLPDVPPPAKPFQPKIANAQCVTADQEDAVAAILDVVSGHRRRPLVITSDRGRGKSSALGIAAARLAGQGVENIIVTGPRPDAVEPVFHHAHRLLQDTKRGRNQLTADGFCLQFVAPDDLLAQPRKTRLLLVDEAASIPVSMLKSLLQLYSRIVFSTTVHGYEGTGRGFAVNFVEHLHACAPQWSQLQLQTPVRWAPQDPLEEFVFRALLLDAEPAQLEIKDFAGIEQCEFEFLKGGDPNISELDLSSIFGLFVLAHYRTRPSDLRAMLDDNVSICVCRHRKQVIAAALVIKENIIDQDTACQVYQGRRRPHGDILQQILLSHCGLLVASDYRYARIMRIAVLPGLRRQGVGSALIGQIKSWALTQAIDVLGTSFAATASMCQFWDALLFKPVHVGMTRDQVTACHSVVMLMALNPEGRVLLDRAMEKLRHVFRFLLAEPLRDLETDLVVQIIQSLEYMTTREAFSLSERQEINAYANAFRGYEMSKPLILAVLLEAMVQPELWSKLEKRYQQLLVKKVLQHHSWEELAASLSLTGKAETQKLMRQALGILLGEKISP